MSTRRARFVSIGITLILGSVLGIGASPEFLGSNPEEIVDRLGPPDRVYSADSPDADVQAVVFFYDDFRYVYFYENRVWQIRLDERSEHDIEGFSDSSPERSGDTDGQTPVAGPGDDHDALLDAFGNPVHDDGESLVFELEDRGYPVRLRVFLDDEDRALDMYLYRADY